MIALIRKFLTWAVGTASGFIAIAVFGVGGLMVFLGGPWAGEEIWWRVMIAPAFARAEDLKTQDRPAEALPIALSALEKRPNDERLLRLVSDLYIQLDQPLLAHFYLQALTAAQGHLGVYDGDDYDRLAKLPIFHEQHMIDEKLREEAESTRRSYDQLGENGKLSAPQSASAILAEPAAGRGPPGYFDPDDLVPCGDHKICALDMKDGDMFAAIARHSAQIHDPRVDPDCCAVSLNDPDLRRLNVVEAEFTRQWEANHRGDTITSPAGANALLQLRCRVLAKQLYLIDFVGSGVAKDPKDKNPPGVVIARYAGGILALVIFAGVMMRLEGDDKSKKTG